MPTFAATGLGPEPLFRRWRNDEACCKSAAISLSWSFIARSRLDLRVLEHAARVIAGRLAIFQKNVAPCKVDAASQGVRGEVHRNDGMEPASDQFARLTYPSE